ncbi:hypothetical protein Tco_1116915 [Tanacetum coccineum]
MYKVITTHESQTNEAKHDLSSTGMNAASSVRIPLNRDSHVKNNVLANSKKPAKKVAVYVRKNKKTDNTSENVISNKENVIDVDVANASKAKTLLCVSCLVLHQMTSFHNRLELANSRHRNEQSIQSCVPKVVSLSQLDSYITTRIGNTIPPSMQAEIQRSQDGIDDKDNDKGSKSRSQSMKEQAYNEDKDQEHSSLNDKSNLTDLMKECHQ